jgi:hypothetical protein
MEPETLRQIQAVEDRGRTYVEKLHGDTSSMISKMISEVQATLTKLSESVHASAITNNNTSNKIDNILDNTKETNGRVHKLEIEIRHLENNTRERDSSLEKLVIANEAKLKAWVWRNLLIVTLAGSFLWIKESRDIILSIIKAFI